MYDKTNIFARILRGEIPCNKIYEDEYVLAFHDIHPKAKIHALLITKGEYTNLADFSSKASDSEIKKFFSTIEIITKKLGINESGYRVITNTGHDGTQTIFHFHVHILGGQTLYQM